jgi:ABC-type sulfate transport system permease component
MEKTWIYLYMLFEHQNTNNIANTVWIYVYLFFLQYLYLFIFYTLHTFLKYTQKNTWQRIWQQFFMSKHHSLLI